jgi:hypothetical protein
MSKPFCACERCVEAKAQEKVSAKLRVQHHQRCAPCDCILLSEEERAEVQALYKAYFDRMIELLEGK